MDKTAYKAAPPGSQALAPPGARVLSATPWRTTEKNSPGKPGLKTG